MKTPTKSSLRIAGLERSNDVLSLALSDLANGHVKWFTRYNYAIGISRPNGASGGIAIEKIVGGMVSGYYWETFAAESLAHIAADITGENSPYNAELLRRRSCIEEAQAFVAASRQAA